MKNHNSATSNFILDTVAGELASGVLEIRTGTAPASANDAATGTLLVSISIPVDPFAAASAEAMTKVGTWTGTAAATGTAGWARLRNTADTVRVDVTVGAEGMLQLDSVGYEITLNDIVEVSTLTVRL